MQRAEVELPRRQQSSLLQSNHAAIFAPQPAAHPTSPLRTQAHDHYINDAEPQYDGQLLECHNLIVVPISATPYPCVPQAPCEHNARCLVMHGAFSISRDHAWRWLGTCGCARDFMCVVVHAWVSLGSLITIDSRIPERYQTCDESGTRTYLIDRHERTIGVDMKVYDESNLNWQDAMVRATAKLGTVCHRSPQLSLPHIKLLTSLTCGVQQGAQPREVLQSDVLKLCQILPLDAFEHVPAGSLTELHILSWQDVMSNHAHRYMTNSDIAWLQTELELETTPPKVGDACGSAPPPDPDDRVWLQSAADPSQPRPGTRYRGLAEYLSQPQLDGRKKVRTDADFEGLLASIEPGKSRTGEPCAISPPTACLVCSEGPLTSPPCAV